MRATEPLGIPGVSYPEGAENRARRRPQRPARTTALDRFLLRGMVRGLGAPAITLSLWDGTGITPAGARSIARVRIQDRLALIRMVLRPMISCGDLYSAGRVEVDGDLVAALEAVYRATTAVGASPALERLWDWIRPNSLARSRGNIHHHYDIGNDFYSLWLDREARQYTCAYFPDPEMTLEQAQVAKLHHVCRKLRLRPGERVVEAGCGWGGLARFMARHYGVAVRAYNISHEQIAHARRRAVEEGLDDRVEFVEDDYRGIRGCYDAFVSVGMLEHVGRARYAALGRVIDRCLTDEGRGLIHTIGRNHPCPINPWIRKRIFPGSYAPTLRELSGVLEPSALSVLDVENLRLHYALTLRHWLERFRRHREEVREMFDERFVRAWTLYLSGSIAAFTTGWLQLFQVLFARPRANRLPWSRAHLYEPEDRGTAP